jgi:hypothetical protein
LSIQTARDGQQFKPTHTAIQPLEAFMDLLRLLAVQLPHGREDDLAHAVIDDLETFPALG